MQSTFMPTQNDDAEMLDIITPHNASGWKLNEQYKKIEKYKSLLAQKEFTKLSPDMLLKLATNEEKDSSRKTIYFALCASHQEACREHKLQAILYFADKSFKDFGKSHSDDTRKRKIFSTFFYSLKALRIADENPVIKIPLDNPIIKLLEKFPKDADSSLIEYMRINYSCVNSFDGINGFYHKILSQVMDYTFAKSRRAFTGLTNSHFYAIHEALLTNTFDITIAEGKQVQLAKLINELLTTEQSFRATCGQAGKILQGFDSSDIACYASMFIVLSNNPLSVELINENDFQNKEKVISTFRNLLLQMTSPIFVLSLERIFQAVFIRESLLERLKNILAELDHTSQTLLASGLIAPTQRAPRYELLFKEMKRCVSLDFLDRLVQAIPQNNSQLNEGVRELGDSKALIHLIPQNDNVMVIKYLQDNFILQLTKRFSLGDLSMQTALNQTASGLKTKIEAAAKNKVMRVELEAKSDEAELAKVRLTKLEMEVIKLAEQVQLEKQKLESKDQELNKLRQLLSLKETQEAKFDVEGHSANFIVDNPPAIDADIQYFPVVSSLPLATIENTSSESSTTPLSSLSIFSKMTAYVGTLISSVYSAGKIPPPGT